MINSVYIHNQTALQFFDNTTSRALTKAGIVLAIGLTALHMLRQKRKIPLSSGAKIWKQLHSDGVYGASEDGEKNQNLYNLWFACTIQKTKDILCSSSEIKIESILNTIAEERRQIAKKLNHYNSSSFGQWRDSSNLNPIERETRATSILKNSRYHKYSLAYNTLLATEQKKYIQIEGRLPLTGKPISLSAIHKLFNHIQVIHPQYVKTDTPIQDVLNHLDHIIERILQDKSISQEKLMKGLAHIHWWLAQLMLFERGSAAITEILIQAIAAAKGYPSSRWEKGILPDLEAIYQSEENFIAAYPRLYHLS